MKYQITQRQDPTSDAIITSIEIVVTGTDSTRARRPTSVEDALVKHAFRNGGSLQDMLVGAIIQANLIDNVPPHSDQGPSQVTMAKAAAELARFTKSDPEIAGEMLRRAHEMGRVEQSRYRHQARSPSVIPDYYLTDEDNWFLPEQVLKDLKRG